MSSSVNANNMAQITSNINLKTIIDAYLDSSKTISEIYRGFSISKLSFAYPLSGLRDYGGRYYLNLNDIDGRTITIICPVDIFKKAKKEYELEDKSSIDVVVDNIWIGRNAKITISISSLMANGISLREIEKRRIIKYCNEKGYYDRVKKQMPSFISSIALITTNTGNTQSDITNQTGLILECMDIYKCSSDEKEIAKIIYSTSNSGKYQMVVLFRGGNEDEHMLKFSRECVLDEVVNSSILIASAIGHDVDQPIVQDIADIGFSSPSSFAKEIFAINKSFLLKTDELQRKIEEASLEALRSEYKHLTKTNKEIRSIIINYIFKDTVDKVKSLRIDINSFLSEIIQRRVLEKIGILHVNMNTSVGEAVNGNVLNKITSIEDKIDKNIEILRITAKSKKQTKIIIGVLIIGLIAIGMFFKYG